MIELTIQIPNETIKVKVQQGENLLHAIRTAGVNIDAPCNGNGTCGKCRVKLMDGSVKHKNNFKNKESGTVLACSCTVVEPATICVPKESLLDVNNIRVQKNTDDYEERFYRLREKFASRYNVESHVQKIELHLEEPTLDDNISDVTRIKKHLRLELGCSKVEINTHLLQRIPVLLRESNFKVAVVYTWLDEDKIRVIDIKPQGQATGYGVAVDVGTTSVAACLVDLDTNQILGEAACANAQSKYGADVINRIIYAIKGDGLKELKEAVVKESINPLIMELCKANGIKSDEIIIFTASANTTMTQLLLGVYPDFLRKEPYIPALTDTRDLDISAADIGLCINNNALIHLSPAVASYVGGDISAGVLPAMIQESDKLSILIDLGTNGEIVLGNSDFLMTCACSAGPAFEGGEISCGMRAAPGAIEAVTIGEDYQARLNIIGAEKPYGICGSGIIDLISELKRVGLIDARGKFKKDIATKYVKFDQYGIGQYIVAEKEQYGLDEDIYITEVDIDNFIRAKAAVYSATYVLLSSVGMDFEDLDEVKVAGGIGNHINIKNAINIGLFPDINPEKYTFIGNSSLIGSYLSLTNKKAQDYIDETAEQMTYIELSVYPGYMDEFISASFIPHTNLQRFPNHNKMDGVAKDVKSAV